MSANPIESPSLLDNFDQLKQFLQHSSGASIADRQSDLSRLLDVLSNQVSELTQENQQLKQDATIDKLTQITNRRGFDQRMEAEWHRCMREGISLAVVVLDVDNFKKYNDSYGHQQGDCCLQEVGRALKQSLHRSGDLAARYGGEEFVVILPNTTSEQAAVVAETIRKTLNDRAIEHRANPQGDYKVSASLGVAHVIPSPQLSSQDLIEQADQALYQAKESGRNRVVAAENPHDRRAEQIHENVLKLWKGHGRQPSCTWGDYEIKLESYPQRGAALVLYKATQEPIARFYSQSTSSKRTAEGLGGLTEQDAKQFSADEIKKLITLERAAQSTKANASRASRKSRSSDLGL